MAPEKKHAMTACAMQPKPAYSFSLCSGPWKQEVPPRATHWGSTFCDGHHFVMADILWQGGSAHLTVPLWLAACCSSHVPFARSLIGGPLPFGWEALNMKIPIYETYSVCVYGHVYVYPQINANMRKYTQWFSTQTHYFIYTYTFIYLPVIVYAYLHFYKTQKQYCTSAVLL